MQLRMLFILIHLSCGLHGQVLKPGDYKRDSLLGNFEGTWVWRSDQSSFKIVLQKIRYHNPLISVDADLTAGWHEFLEEGIKIESSLDKVGDTSITSVTLWGRSQTATVLSLTFKDLTRNRSFYVLMELIGTDGRRAVWRSTYQEAVNTDGTKIMEGRTVPNNIVLEKLE